MFSRILSFSIGLSIIIITSLLISKNPKHIQIRFIIQLLIIETTFGYFILHSTIGSQIILKLCHTFDILLLFASEGVNFVFGEINTKQETPIFFLKVLCPIIFISALIGVLQYSRILSLIIKIIGTVLSKISGMGKLESFNAISSLILGQSENFIIYKNIIHNIPEINIHNMAITSISTVSLSMVGAYINILDPKYIILALILNIFSTFIILSLINPNTIIVNQDLYTYRFFIKENNFFETIGEYILIGFKIATTVAAMLIGFIAIIAAFNTLFKILFGIPFQKILSYLFLPLAWTIGIPLHETLTASNVMATKLISNEFIAMIALQQNSSFLSPQSIGILSVFLVSFSNITSIGILIGVIKKLNKAQGKLVSNYGFRLIFSSTLINMLSATIAGLIL